MAGIAVVEGSLEDELSFDLRDLLPEECGLAAAINVPVASQYVHDSLLLQDHRGEDSVGIISSHKGKFTQRKRVGSVREQFLKVDFANRLPGSTAIGHTRYSTGSKAGSVSDTQPLVLQTRYGLLALGHNGEMIGAKEKKEQMIQKGSVFQSSSDTEVFAHVMAQSGASCLEDALVAAAKEIPAAYSMLAMTPEKVIAFRDKHGVRPMSIGSVGDGFVVTSENYFYDQGDPSSPEFLDDILPGEMVIFEKGNKHYQKRQYADPEEAFCIFEGFYFSNPRSRIKGVYHEDFRIECGRQLAQEYDHLEADLVIPILDSGKHAAWGFCDESDLLYREAFMRIHNPPNARKRSFTSPTDEQRIKSAYQKLNLRPDQVKGKTVVTIDDTIVRSNTIRTLNKRLRDAGAEKIYNLVAAPPIINQCPYGIDLHEVGELIARHNDVDEIANYVGSDGVFYLPPSRVDAANRKTYNIGNCDGCYTGKYPVQPKSMQIITPEQIE